MDLYLAALLIQLFATSQVLVDQVLPDPYHYRPLLGKRVMLEGLAWDYQKGWTGRILLASGREVFVSNASPKLVSNNSGRVINAIPQGCLVRAVGVLTFKIGPRRPSAPSFTPVAGITIAQPAYIPQHFSLEMESFEIIDSVNDSIPRLMPK